MNETAKKTATTILENPIGITSFLLNAGKRKCIGT
jgi:hypothetical protein